MIVVVVGGGVFAAAVVVLAAETSVSHPIAVGYSIVAPATPAAERVDRTTLYRSTLPAGASSTASNI
jgi:hypothetical protein